MHAVSATFILLINHISFLTVIRGIVCVHITHRWEGKNNFLILYNHLLKGLAMIDDLGLKSVGYD